MGARGPAPTPTNQLADRGSWRAKDRDDYGVDHILCNKAPSPPKHLDEHAKSCWKEICKHLMTMRLLGPSNLKPLERYCVLWGRWREACTLVENHGSFTFDKEGNPVESAYASAMYKLDTAMLKLEVQFGLTPSARARVPMSSKPAESDGSSASKYMSKNLKMAGA